MQTGSLLIAYNLEIYIVAISSATPVNKGDNSKQTQPSA